MSRLMVLSKFSNPHLELPSLTLFRSIATISPFHTLSRDQSPIDRTSPIARISPVAITCPATFSPRFTQSHRDFSSSIVKSPSQSAALGLDVSTASPRSKYPLLSYFSVNGAQKSHLQVTALYFGASIVSHRFKQSPCDVSCALIAKSPPQAAAVDFGASTASPRFTRNFCCASIAKSPLHAAALDFGASTVSPRFTRNFCCTSIAKSPPQATALDFGASTASPRFTRNFCCASIAKSPSQAAALDFGVSTASRHSTFSPLRSYVNRAQSVAQKHLSPRANNSALSSVSPIFISARGYSGTPPFRVGKVIKPAESELMKKVDFRCAVEQRQVSEESLEDTAIELTFLHLPAVDSSVVPYFRIHSLMAACVKKGKLVHIIDNEIRQTNDWSSIRKHTGQEITKEPMAKGISAEEMKKYWYDNRPDHEKFWSERLLKHHKFSTSQCIEKYESLIWKFACEYLKDNKLGNYLASKGFETGSYYNSHDYLAAVDEFFGVKCYATFKNHGQHPAAKEIAVLVKKEEGMVLEKEGVQELRDHPLHDFVGQGKFLLPDI